MSSYNTQKMKFSIYDFLSKCDQIRSFLKLFLKEKVDFFSSKGYQITFRGKEEGRGW